MSTLDLASSHHQSQKAELQNNHLLSDATLTRAPATIITFLLSLFVLCQEATLYQTQKIKSQ